MIDQSAIDAIRANTDMILLVGQTVPLKKRGADWFGLCPNPNHKEKTPSFKVDNVRHIFKCFGCDLAGDAIAWVEWRDHCTFPEAVAKLSNGAVPHTNGHANGRDAAAQPRRVKAKFITPVPADIEPPDCVHFRHGKPTAVWTYRNAAGEVMNYVARYDPPGDKKVFSPWSWTTKGWAMKGLPAPRGLYGVEHLAIRPDAPVAVVEGEKCCDAARTLLPEHVVVTWHGGTQAFKQTDWGPLAGRDLTYWPDADDVGVTAMQQLAKLLKAGRVLALPADLPKGFDAADALADGWTPERTLEFLAPPKPAEAKGPIPESSVDYAEPMRGDEPPVFDPADTAGTWPFALLGHRSGVYTYLPGAGGTVISLSGSAHTKANFMMLAPLNFWEGSFGCRDNKGWDAVANALIQQQHRRGIFDPTALRGRGAWWDAGKVVIHLGDRLLVNGEPVPIKEFKTDYTYEVGPKIRHADARSLQNADARKLIELCQMMSWERTISGYLLAGWCALAPICGALKWRPHIALQGAASVGKSYIVSKIIAPTLGQHALSLASSITEPGIRRALGSDARPVLVDEFEAKDDLAKKRIESVMGLMRYSSSETDAMIVKGSNSSAGVEFFKIRSMFCTAAIGSLISDYADRTRISVLNLRLLAGKAGADRFAEIEAAQRKLLTEAWVDGLHARIVGMVETIRANADTFAIAGAEVLGTRRLGDQMGTLLAGAYALTSRDEITPEKAEAWLKQQDWTEERDIVTDTDGPLCFSRIMEHQIMCEARQTGSVRRTIGELLGFIADKRGDDVVSYQTAVDTCRRHGVLLRDGDMVAVSNTHSAIKEILWDSPWAANWHARLKTIAGAESSKVTLSFGSGAAAKAILVPRGSAE